MTKTQKKESIEIFLPVYNESKNLEKNILKLKSFLKKSRIDAGITVVNDNSTDDTKEKLGKISKKLGINHVNFSIGPSRRENLAVAMSKSKADYIIFMDFDLATDLKSLPELISELKKGHDIVTGSRYMKDSVLRREKYRLVVSKLYNWFMRVYFNSKIKDHQCGFKGFKRKAFLDLKKAAGYDKKYMRGWFWDVEMLVRGQKKKYKVKEIPVSWIVPDRKSSVRVKREIRMIPRIIMLRFKK
ncbi:MAG: glycosyltransferase [Candidatus Nanoarchaeia archaeon]